MQLKVKAIADLYNASPSRVHTIICRPEFNLYRSGGNGGFLLEYNEESKELLKKWLKRRGNYHYGSKKGYCTGGVKETSADQHRDTAISMDNVSA